MRSAPPRLKAPQLPSPPGGGEAGSCAARAVGGAWPFRDGQLSAICVHCQYRMVIGRLSGIRKIGRGDPVHLRGMLNLFADKPSSN